MKITMTGFKTIEDVAGFYARLIPREHWEKFGELLVETEMENKDVLDCLPKMKFSGEVIDPRYINQTTTTGEENEQ